MTCCDKRQRLRNLAHARARPLSRRVGRLSPETVAGLLAFRARNRDRNILAAAIAGRKARDLETADPAYLSGNYAQVELQGLPEGRDPGVRENYTRPLEAGLVAALESLIGRCYRARLAVLKPGGAIPRHLDDPRDLRIVSVLAGAHEFTLFGKRETHRIPMRPGELWFVNTAWEHEVRNTGGSDRIALLANVFDLPGNL